VCYELPINETSVSNSHHQIVLSYLVEFITSGPVVAMELKSTNGIDKWRTLLGPTDSATARNKAPMSIRAKFGTGRFDFLVGLS